MPESVMILDVRVDAVDKAHLLEEIAKRIEAGSREYLANVNINAINIAQQDDSFRRILNNSPVVYCDGEGVRLGARLLGVTLPPRIVLTYWIWELCAFAADKGYSIFLLGGSRGAAEEAGATMKRKFPSIKIVGTHHGYFDKVGEESDRVVDMIAAARPNILFVCFGMPLQEHWSCRNLQRLAANVVLFGGSTIEYASGRKKLAPAWMSRHGMEWFYRLLQEPRRLWRRYLIGNPLFLLKVLMQLLRDGRQR
ncbi:MAG: glycosyl transferase, WecB/TagA/CpsF family [Bacteroidetes bacterium]|jgi:N-acetylglucosaminyldiphosphoundecaprenol N-acetyl-beta-D-mannosaminyltransferase|nr:glycosyl transferase, WecB/TagA/CpsF family [Bacteroidota bacterium]